MVLKIELFDGAIAELTTPFNWDTFDSGKIFDVLFNAHVLENRVGLWTVADQFLDLVEVFADI